VDLLAVQAAEAHFLPTNELNLAELFGGKI